ncbi:cation:proton antiporter [Micromonospora chersina]|uniref:cation:proton antiporter n=1 Tax=Micromonospora chersina TaxID=47854 RepID=UPI003711C643
MPTTVAPIGADQVLLLLLQLGVLLLLALLLGRLAVRLRLPAIVGELSAGVLLGPSVLEPLAPGVSDWLLPRDTAQFHLLDAVGMVGVLLLVGIIGTELDWRMVRRQGATAARISLAGFLLPLLLGTAVGLVLPASFVAGAGDRTVFALFLGVALCVTAIPVIAKTLLDMNLMHRNVGQLTLASGAIDDVLGWLMLSVVAAMATTGVRAGQVALSVLHLVVILLVAVVVGRPVVRWTFRATTRSAEAGPTLTAAAAIVFLGAAGTHALGMEPVFGAFLCGILINVCGGLEPARLAPLRTMVLAVFAPLFFATAGLRMDLTGLADPLVLLAALAVLAVAVVSKFAGTFVAALGSRLNRWEALAIGAGMNSRGVVQMIIAMVGLRLGVLNTQSYTVVMLVAIVTSLMAPPVLRAAMRRVETTAEEQLRQAARAVPAPELRSAPPR